MNDYLTTLGIIMCMQKNEKYFFIIIDMSNLL